MMQALLSRQRQLKGALLMGSALLLGTVAQAVELKTVTTDEPELKRRDIVITYSDLDFDEDANVGAAQDDLGLRDGASGGIDRLYWENEADGDWRTYIDSFWLMNPDKLGVNLDINNGYTVYFDLNFLMWESYELGAGVWYPPTNLFPLLSADALEKEINKFDLSLRVDLGNDWRVETAYSLFKRYGDSLTTRFGDDFQWGVRRPSRGFFPSLMTSDESVHTLDLKLIKQDYIDLKGIRLHYQRREVKRTTVIERALQQPAANRFITQDEGSKDDLFAASGFIRKELTDTLVGSAGFVFTRLDGDLTGDRIFGAAPEAAYDPDFAALQLRDRGFLDLESARRLNQWVFNANAVYTPSETVRWIAGIRLERLSTKTTGSYLDTWRTADWIAGEVQNEEANSLLSSEKKALDLSAFLEVRHTGWEHVLLFSRVEAGNQSGDLEEGWTREELQPDQRNPLDLLQRDTDFDRQFAFWEAGAHYYPSSGLKFSLSGYLKVKDNGYAGWRAEQSGSESYAYPGYIRQQKFHTQDLNAKVQWRILNSLKSISRADYQVSTIDTRAADLPEMESADRERVILSQSLTWTPSPRFFANASVNVVDDLTETPAPLLEGTFAGILYNLPNDYWHADVNLYAVISKLLDVHVTYSYMEYANYINASPQTVPFGTDLEQHHGSVDLILHLREGTRARIGYAIHDREEPSSGGFRDYTVHLISGSLQMIF